ncbi:MAG: hypothetical protein AB7C98_06200 [Acidithiobacillus sp.]
MLQTIEVEIDAQGQEHPVGLNKPLPPSRALLTPPAKEELLLSESALAKDWLKPTEDAAWATLQPASPPSPDYAL